MGFLTWFSLWKHSNHRFDNSIIGWVLDVLTKFKKKLFNSLDISTISNNKCLPSASSWTSSNISPCSFGSKNELIQFQIIEPLVIDLITYFIPSIFEFRFSIRNSLSSLFKSWLETTVYRLDSRYRTIFKKKLIQGLFF